MQLPPAHRIQLLLCLGLLAGAVTASRASTQSVTYARRSAGGVAVHVITVDLNDPRVKVTPVLSSGGIYSDETFAEMVKRTRPVAAINGTFFSKSNLKPIGDIVIDGQLRHAGLMGTAMALTPDNRAEFRRVERSRGQDWSRFETVMACGPTLVKDGQIDLRATEEGFQDPHVMGAGVRSAVGLTAGNKLLLVSVPQGVTLERLAQVMKGLGCVQAMNLDGGASMAMYFRGKTIVPAGRRLTNLLLVYENAQHVKLPGSPTLTSVAVNPAKPATPQASGTPAPFIRPPVVRPTAGGSTVSGEGSKAGQGSGKPADPPVQTASSVQLAAIGMPVYPGAQLGVKGESLPGVEILVTQDPVEKVAVWFRRQFGDSRVESQRFPDLNAEALRVTLSSGKVVEVWVSNSREKGTTIRLDWKP